MRQKVVIIGHGYLSRLALIRSLGKADYEVSVIVSMYGSLNTTRPLDCYSKYVSNVYYCNAKDGEGLVKILLHQCADKSQKVVIIPDSDYSAAFVDKYKEQLADGFLFPRAHGNATVEKLMDKEVQKEIARSLGIITVGTKKLHLSEDKSPSLQGISMPCFTKSLMTMGGGKQCFRKCENEADLRLVLESFLTKGYTDILVEDYIEIEKEYALVGLTDGKRVYIPGVVRFEENCQCHLGIARKGSIIPVTCFEKLIEQYKAYVLETQFVGLFDIDFFYSKGKYYFCEMNFRYGGSGYAYTASGINLPAMFVEMLMESKGVDECSDYITQERTYINERMLIDDLVMGNISIRQFNHTVRSVDIRFVPDKEDRGPQKKFRKMVVKAKAKHLLKKILHRY